MLSVLIKLNHQSTAKIIKNYTCCSGKCRHVDIPSRDWRYIQISLIKPFFELRRRGPPSNTTMSGLKYGLNIQKKGPAGPNKTALIKKRTIFDDEDDNEDDKLDKPEDEAPSRSTKSRGSKLTAPPVLKSKYATDSHNAPDLATRLIQDKRTTEAAETDPTVYDYDAAYDALHAKTASRKAAEREDALERRPKYMENLMAAAEVRKRDQLRAKDRLLQKEREAEGEEFADKEKFVTEAYKEQQEEVRKAEEAERLREEEESRKRRGKGMTGFYRSVMDDEERTHRELVQAAESVQKDDTTKDSAVVEEEQTTEKDAARLAREMNAHGAKVIINDEGQVADKRQLLSAGLNIAPKPKVTSATKSGSNTARQAGMPSIQGRGDAQKASRERQTRMMEAQLEQATKRAAEDEAEDRAKVERAAKSRKTDSDVSSAKERYLQRKKEAAAAAAAEKEKEKA